MSQRMAGRTGKRDLQSAARALEPCPALLCSAPDLKWNGSMMEKSECTEYTPSGMYIHT